MYAGRVTCCALMNHVHYVPCTPLRLGKKTGQTDGRTLDRYITRTDAASIINAHISTGIYIAIRHCVLSHHLSRVGTAGVCIISSCWQYTVQTVTGGRTWQPRQGVTWRRWQTTSVSVCLRTALALSLLCTNETRDNSESATHGNIIPSHSVDNQRVNSQLQQLGSSA